MEAKSRVFGKASDEFLVSEYLRKNTSLEDVTSNLLPHLKNGKTAIGENQKSLSIPMPTVTNKPDVYAEAFKRTRLKNLNLSTFDKDLKDIASQIESAGKNWQSKERMENTKYAIEAMNQRLKQLQLYDKDYNGGALDLSKQINAYDDVLKGWDELTDEYGKYKSSEEYNDAVKRQSLSVEELEKIYAKAEGLEKYSDDEVKAYIKSYSALAGSKDGIFSSVSNKPLDDETKKYLKSYGFKNTSEVLEAIKVAEAREK